MHIILTESFKLIIHKEMYMMSVVNKLLVNFFKGIIALFLPMDKPVRVKLIQCLGMEMKVWFHLLLKIYSYRCRKDNLNL